MSEIDIRYATAAMALETESKKLDDDVITPGVAALVSRPDLGFFLVADKDQNAAVPAAKRMLIYWHGWEWPCLMSKHRSRRPRSWPTRSAATC